MIKRIFKTGIKIFLATAMLLFISYLSFIGWEYITGNKYVKYLKNNIETVSLNSNFDYKIMNDDIELNNLIFVGEIHGFKEPNKFDYDFFKYLNKKFNIRNYFSEFDYVQSLILNEFLNTGDEELLKKVLNNWVVVQGRNNKDYYNKYINLCKLNKHLPENKKFKFIGIDKIQDIKLTIEYLNNLCNRFDLPLIEKNQFDDLSIIEKKVKDLIVYNNDSVKEFELNHILKNIEYEKNETNREKVLYDNFQSLYEYFNLDTEKVYGYFGLFHILQYKVNNNQTFTSMIRSNHIVPKDRILSVGFIFLDSKMVMKSNWLPRFIRSENEYTKLDISYDNIFFMYLYGINDLKRVTKKHTKSIIKFNGKDTPYYKSNRLKSAYQIFSFAGKMDFTEKGKEYMQYTIFVRNSEWAEPMK